MAYRDLGNFHHRAGDLHAAVRFHTKSREYCTLPAHVLDMCLAVIQLAFEMGNYTFVRNHVVKAESALDNGSGSLGGNAADGNNTSRATKQTKAVHLPGMVAPQASKQEQAESKEKQIIINRLAIASGLADLGQGYFARAARTLLNLDPVSVKAAASEGLSPVSPGDIAMYAVLCGLATFDRAAVKRQLVENSSLRSLWENEPHLKPILHAFFTSEYATALHLLEKHNPRHLFDIHLSQHVPALLTSIQDNAVTSFTKPFSSVSLDKMASSFAWTQDETRAHVIRLIQNGTLKARIDTKRGVLKANQPDVRRQLFENAMQVGDQLEETSRKVQLRIKLLQHDLVVKDSNRARAPTRQSTLESKP